ncbi:tRNA (adenosine(37)-N6)-threonylcarbamoyltransferase complex ATPase subunit type 1 TsaE [Mesorhizobium sp. CAU 1741]|uniref:tRNA (adenosine(37)-N6)-threonylcarbamoyltransferase complex ATPase subunit type 1 TsaE n=1 Tax=Mesorhizobium sp. CAU 1741 TaxID=3140366 RepID=UPI00325AA734
MTARRTLQRDLADEAATNRLGDDIAAMLKPGDLLALVGDLGMGKSTLARAIIRGLAGDQALEVPSPTFTLVQAYETRIPVKHVDLYRLASADEVEELGIFDAPGETAVLVEWPERAWEALPGERVVVRLSEHGAGRRAEIEAEPDFMERLDRSLAIRAFLDMAGMGGAHRRFLVGDASTRAYEIVEASSGEPLILMNAPPRPDGPPIRDGKPYSRIAHLAETVVPFVAIAQALCEEGFAAPQIPAADLENGILLVENLGWEGVLDADGQPIAERYLAAAELLAELHGRTWPAQIEVDDAITHTIPPYDHGAMAIETELLTDWYLPHATGKQPDAAQRDAFGAGWRRMFDILDGTEKSLVLRDFHSPNIIWRRERTGHDRIGLIDFQDAMIGPSAYDVASLAMDARVTIPTQLERQIVAAYCEARREQGRGFDRDRFGAAYAIMAAQRNSKILGIFVRLNVRDGKPGYLRHLPRIRDYVVRAFEHPVLEPLRDIYRQAGVL